MKTSNEAKNFDPAFVGTKGQKDRPTIFRTLGTLERATSELLCLKKQIAQNTRRRTRLVSRLLRQVDHTLGHLADIQTEVQALQTACEVLSVLEGALVCIWTVFGLILDHQEDPSNPKVSSLDFTQNGEHPSCRLLPQPSPSSAPSGNSLSILG